MKNLVKLSLLLILPVFISAQTQETQLASLHRSLKNASNDTIRMDVYLNLALYYNEINRDSSLFYLAKGLPIAQKLKLKLYEAQILENRGYMLTGIGNYPKALESFLASLKIVTDPESEKYAWNLRNGQTPQKERLTKLGYLHLTMGHLYGRTNNTDKQISSYHQTITIAESIQDSGMMGLGNMNLGNVYLELNKLDSALFFEQNALSLEEGKYRGVVLNIIGQIYEAKGDYKLALDAYRKSLNHSSKQNNLTGITGSLLSLSSLYINLHNPDSSLYYSRKALTNSRIIRGYWDMAQAYQLIADALINQGKGDSAYTYLKLATGLRDSLNNVQRENLLAYQNLGFDEQLRLRKLEEEKATYQNKIRTNTLMGSLFTLVVIAIFLFILFRRKQKAKQKIELAYDQLKSTQAQLIQSEKMASLGELTAGIAHEIQNPLNFVNNFSDLNKELIDELKEELAVGNTHSANEIADDIKNNEEKINHHGKRAESIVKGMLLHSRASSGEKQLTDINALCDEYLRLSYHGMRAKDKTFNADFKLDLDENLPKIEVVPQDIGRVLLNLINNAFYAAPLPPEGGFKDPTYIHKPEVVVSTSSSPLTEGGNRGVKICVKDNGPGIPHHIKDKIFQPFFTTKPTGSGTGLGLSLTYDIIKAHGGTISVKTTENEARPPARLAHSGGDDPVERGTEFIIQIPFNHVNHSIR